MFYFDLWRCDLQRSLLWLREKRDTVTSWRPFEERTSGSLSIDGWSTGISVKSVLLLFSGILAISLGDSHGIGIGIISSLGISGPS